MESVTTAGPFGSIPASAEHDLDTIAPLVATHVTFYSCRALRWAWVSGSHLRVLQRFSEPTGVMTPDLA